MRVVLFQSHYPHGGKRKRQTYLSSSLMNLGSRLLEADIEVDFIDLNYSDLTSHNVRQKLDRCDAIGFTVVGPPYIPTVAENIAFLRQSGYKQPILVGGEGVTRLQAASFQAWFGEYERIFWITTDCEEIEAVLGLPPSSLRSGFTTSGARMLSILDEPNRRRYLTNEFPLFISNGCVFNCKFCAAAKNRKEQYRTITSLKDEVTFICDYLQSIGHSRFTAYLSTLDAFQNPKELETALACVDRIAKEHGIKVYLRCLATSHYTIRAIKADPALPHRLRSYGLRIVGFGADGADEETWRRENKKHNKLSEIMECVTAMKNAGITPELLMVIGFKDDRWKNLIADIKFSLAQAFRGAVIRPYLGKSKTPGAGGDRWLDGDPEIEVFLRDRSLLTRLDYAMIGSRETHPRWAIRWLSNATYLLIIGMLAPFGLCPTRPLTPVPKRGIGRWIAHAINHLMPFDR